jgi:hypothetical protein
MPAWATVSITLGAAVVAVLGTLAATWMQLRHSRRAREAAERERWREKGADVVAPLLSLIEDAEPLRLGLARGNLNLRVLDLSTKWGFLRNQLTVFATAHPSPEVGKTVAEITKAVPLALMNGEIFVKNYVGPDAQFEGREEARASAETSHARAAELAEKLLVEVRGSEAQEKARPDA